ncbi:MAG: hypothetical protein H6672_11710 [Anaerolineaceae bacterium]|nr:hypothetical protein [Anaerolineaceae bacterium]
MSLNQINDLINSLQHTSTLLLIVGVVVALALTTAVSSLRSGLIRLLFFFGLASVTYYFSQQLDDVNGSFFLNISTELLGAVLTYIVLGSWVTSMRWTFPVIFVLILLSTFPIEFADPTQQPVFLNLSSELIGAFLLTILIHNRGWLWNLSGQNRPSKRQQAKRQKQYALALERRKTLARQDMQDKLQAEMADWRMNRENWNVAIKIESMDSEEAKASIRHLQKIMPGLQVTKIATDEDTQRIHCYLVATVSGQ